MRPQFTSIQDPDFMRRLEEEFDIRPVETINLGPVRPLNARLGASFFDTVLGKPIWAESESAGTITWVDATGATV